MTPAWPLRYRRQRCMWPMRVLLCVIFLQGCGTARQGPRIEPVTLSVAPKTSRSDAVTETIIVLTAHNFTIDYADSRRDQFALLTNWRTITRQSAHEEDTGVLELRDRAILHLSPRAIQSDRTTQVSSRLQFDVQLWVAKTDKWIDISADDTLVEEYGAIVYEIQSRLRRRGYIFN